MSTGRKVFVEETLKSISPFILDKLNRCGKLGLIRETINALELLNIILSMLTTIDGKTLQFYVL